MLNHITNRYISPLKFELYLSGYLTKKFSSLRRRRTFNGKNSVLSRLLLKKLNRPRSHREQC